jgi:hypothetical protein
VADEDSQEKKVILARFEIKSLQAKGVKMVLQWVPSHCGLLGIEKADCLAKLGSYKKQPPNKISFHSAKAHINEEFAHRTFTINRNENCAIK